MDLADVTAEIAAPADAVWAVVADFAHPQRLAPTIARVELHGPVRIVHSSRGPVIHERVVERDAAAYRFRYAVLDSGDPPFAGVGGYVATVELTHCRPRAPGYAGAARAPSTVRSRRCASSSPAFTAPRSCASRRSSPPVRRSTSCSPTRSTPASRRGSSRSSPTWRAFSTSARTT